MNMVKSKVKPKIIKIKQPKVPCLESICGWSRRLYRKNFWFLPGARTRIRITPKISHQIWLLAPQDRETQHIKCYYCNRFLLRESPRIGVWEIDHIYPWIMGGNDTLENLCAACIVCNRSKGDSIHSFVIKEKEEEK